jgi:hypothetical protein
MQSSNPAPCKTIADVMCVFVLQVGLGGDPDEDRAR